MKILFLTSQIPSPESGSTIRPFHLIKNLYKIFNYDIYLISFVDLSKESDTNIVREYCREILLIPIEQDNNKSVLIQTLKNTLSLRSIASKIESKHGVFDPSFYTRGGVQKKLIILLKIIILIAYTQMLAWLDMWQIHICQK